MPFVKLDAGILRSTIWYKRPELEIFLAALLMAEPREYEQEIPTLETDTLERAAFTVPPGWYGFVPASGPGLIQQAVVDQAAGIEALKALAQPELESRSQVHAGRRMVRIDGGYLVLNYMKYRDYDYNAAERMRKLRARRRVTPALQDVTGVTRNGRDVRPNVTHSREQRADADTKQASADALPFESPEFKVAWEAFERHRVEKRAKLTPTATSRALKKLAAMGEPRAIAAINHSLENGWTGIFEPNNPSANGPHQKPNSRRYSQTDDYTKVPKHDGVGAPPRSEG